MLVTLPPVANPDSEFEYLTHKLSRISYEQCCLPQIRSWQFITNSYLTRNSAEQKQNGILFSNSPQPSLCTNLWEFLCLITLYLVCHQRSLQFLQRCGPSYLSCIPLLQKSHRNGAFLSPTTSEHCFLDPEPLSSPEAPPTPSSHEPNSPMLPPLAASAERTYPFLDRFLTTRAPELLSGNSTTSMVIKSIAAPLQRTSCSSMFPHPWHRFWSAQNSSGRYFHGVHALRLLLEANTRFHPSSPLLALNIPFFSCWMLWSHLSDVAISSRFNIHLNLIQKPNSTTSLLPHVFYNDILVRTCLVETQLYCKSPYWSCLWMTRRTSFIFKAIRPAGPFGILLGRLQRWKWTRLNRLQSVTQCHRLSLRRLSPTLLTEILRIPRFSF